MIFHLAVSDLFPGDAIGNFVLAAREALAGAGLPAFIYAERRASGLEGVSPYAAFFERVRPEDVLFYQLSNCDPAWPRFMETPCRRVVYYHNITPGSFFAPFAPETAALLEAGRAARPLIAGADLALANSRYSLAEVEPFLPPETPRRVFPPFLPRQLRLWRREDRVPPAGQRYLLVLGRVAPNKRLEDALDIFSRLQAEAADLRLVIAGTPFAPYAETVRRKIAASPGLSRAVSWAESLTGPELKALLQGAAGLLLTSAHEGFGMPLLEAMLAGIPVFAADRAAVPETLGRAGVLIDPARPEDAAARILKILGDGRAREALLRAQAGRAEELIAGADEGLLLRLLSGADETVAVSGRRPLTILLAMQNFMVGGLEKVVIDIAVLAKKRGHYPIIAYAGEIAGPTREDVERAGLESLRLPETGAERLDFLRRRGVDLVNAHYAAILARECKELGLPFLQTIHNMYLWLDGEGVARWRELDEYTDAYIAVSAKVAEVSAARLGLPRFKMTVIPNGADLIDQKPAGPPETDTALRRELGLPPEGVVFLQTASFYPAKAHGVSLEAFAEARRSRDDLYLVFLGQTADAGYAAGIRAKIERDGLTGYVILPGYRRDVARFLHLARALVAPSFNEGWSLAISEAVQLGVPVVASDVGGAREQLAGTDGALLPAFTEDFAGLSAERYFSLLRDEDFHKTLAPPLTRTLLEMAARPKRTAPGPAAVRRPEEAYAEHLELMLKLAAARPADGALRRPA